MPTVPNRSRKALEELARVCNRLANELTADLKQAATEIEHLKLEIRKIRHVSPTTRSKSPNSSSRKRSTSKNGRSSRKNSGAAHLPASARQKGPPHESSSYVFPKEPFNPPAPPAEPSLNPEHDSTGNN